MGERYEVTIYSNEAARRILYGRAATAEEALGLAATAEAKGHQFVQVRDRTAATDGDAS